MESLPIELIRLIAAVDEQRYRAMLAVPVFARSLTPGVIVDYMILFGYSVEITAAEIRWSYQGCYHRIGAPAVESVAGDTYWYYYGRYHRIGAPAVETTLGDKYWCHSGMYHRVDGPAIELTGGGHVRWYYNGKRHREDGPAVTSPGCEMWYLHGEQHRIGGPAVIRSCGRAEYWINGVRQS